MVGPLVAHWAPRVVEWLFWREKYSKLFNHQIAIHSEQQPVHIYTAVSPLLVSEENTVVHYCHKQYLSYNSSHAHLASTKTTDMHGITYPPTIALVIWHLTSISETVRTYMYLALTCTGSPVGVWCKTRVAFNWISVLQFKKECSLTCTTTTFLDASRNP